MLIRASPPFVAVERVELGFTRAAHRILVTLPGGARLASLGVSSPSALMAPRWRGNAARLSRGPV